MFGSEFTIREVVEVMVVVYHWEGFDKTGNTSSDKSLSSTTYKKQSICHPDTVPQLRMINFFIILHGGSASALDYFISMMVTSNLFSFDTIEAIITTAMSEVIP